MKTATKCAECGNNTDGEEYPLCEYCEHAKECEAPKNIRFYNAYLTGEHRAECKNCDFVSAYWECGCELSHECQTN